MQVAGPISPKGWEDTAQGNDLEMSSPLRATNCTLSGCKTDLDHW